MSDLRRRLLILTSALIWVAPLHAQTASPEDRLRGALRDTTRQLHEAQDEVAALRAEVASLRQQAAAAPAACPRSTDVSPRARTEIERLAAENAALRQHSDEAQQVVTKWQEAQTQWQAGLQQATEQAQARELAAKGLQEQFDQSAARERDCTAKNAQLVQISTELLDRYRDKGWWDLFRAAEPLTQIHRVQLETLQQEYRDKIIVNQIVNTASEVTNGSQP